MKAKKKDKRLAAAIKAASRMKTVGQNLGTRVADKNVKCPKKSRREWSQSLRKNCAFA